jgi:peptidoglycan/xylan/chitin deacetylase (PgdA/CDA1 family)
MFRADAVATLYVVHPVWSRVSSRRHRVPILMYHSVSDVAESGKHPYYQTVTSPEAFARQMGFLREHDYTVVGLEEALGCIAGNRICKQPVVITFDDGFQDFYTNAFPVLNKHGFSATVFLPTAHIGETACSFKGAECMTWSQVEELREAGIRFGSHTVTHPQLRDLNAGRVLEELRSSKETMENRMGCPVASFAYPYAFPESDREFKKRLRGMLQDTGYENGVSTIIGTADSTADRFFLKRLPVNTHDDAPLFQAKLEGAYDWLHTVQYAYKLMASKG